MLGYGKVALKVPMDWVERTIEVGTKPGFTVAKLNGDFADLECPGKELAARFPVSKIPKEILQTHESAWFEIGRGRWLWCDHITLGEARATVELLQALAACPSCHGRIAVSMQDNEPVAGASAKGRSPATLLRQRAGLLLATGIQMPLPWVDTLHQAAHRVSRQRRC